MSKKKQLTTDELEDKYRAKLSKKEVKVQEQIDDLEISYDSGKSNKRKLKRLKKDEKWLNRRLPQSTKKELKLKAQIDELNANSDDLSPKEQQKLKRLEKKYIRVLQIKKAKTESVNKKKRNKFACCLTSVLVVIVLICGTLFGATFFLYNSYAKEYTGISYFDAWKLIGGLYGANEDKIITNPFNVKDDTFAFFKGLQKSLYLDTMFTINKLLSLIPKEDGGTGDGSQTVADIIAEGNPPDQTTPADPNSTGNTYLDTLLGDTKFDFSDLKEFDGTEKTEFFITDKMIAGVMQSILLEADSIPNIAQMTSQLGFDFLQVLEVKQAIINIDEQDNANVTLTIQFKVKQMVEALMQKVSGIPNFVKSLAISIVPKSIFLGATVTPTQNAEPILSINSIDDELIRTVLFTLDSKIGGSISSAFNSISTSLFNGYKTMQEFAGVNGIKFMQTQTDGGLALDSMQVIMRAMNVKTVTTADFLLMIKHLHSADHSGISKEQYIQNLANHSTLASFNSSRDILLGSYGISDTQALTPDNFTAELPNLVGKVDIKNYKNPDGTPLYKCSNEELVEQSRLTDAALAQIFNSFLNKPAEPTTPPETTTPTAEGDGADNTTANTALPFKLNVLELTMDGEDIHIIASIDMDEFLATVIKDDSQFASLKGLITSMFPKQLYVKIVTPYVRDMTEGAISSNIIFNHTKDEVSEDKSDHMLATLLQIMTALSPEQANKLEKTALCKMIDDNVYKALDDMTNKDKTGGIEIKLIEGHVQLPTIYEMLATQINKPDDPEEEKLTTEQLRLALLSYYEYDDKTMQDGSPADNIAPVSLEGDGNFAKRELNEKMFLTKTFSEATLFTDLQNLGNSLSEENIDSNMDITAFKNYNGSAAAKNMAITSLEFGKLINISGKLSEVEAQLGFYKNLRTTNVATDGEFVTFTLSGDLNKEYKFEGESAGKLKIENLCADYIIIQATLKIGDQTGEHTSFVINSANNEDGSLASLLKMINKLSNPAEPITEQSLAEKLTKSVNDSFQTFKDQNMELIPCTNLGDYFGTAFEGKDGFRGQNIYKVVAIKVNGEDKYAETDDETLKNVIYHLNNLYTADGDATPFVSEHQETMKNTDVSGCTPTLDLTSELGKIKTTISDVFLGKTIKSKIDDANGTTMIKFGMLAANSGDATALANRFGVEGVKRFNQMNSMFVGISLPKTLFSANNSFAGKFLPETIYANVFINSADTSDYFNFINNLSEAEMNYLIKITSTEGEKNPIVEKMEKSLAETTGFTITFDAAPSLVVDLNMINNFAQVTPNKSNGGYSDMYISQSI